MTALRRASARSDRGGAPWAGSARPLADLSAATGYWSVLCPGWSRVTRPTLELLLPLARAYGVTLDELVGAPFTGDPRIHLRPSGFRTLLPKITGMPPTGRKSVRLASLLLLRSGRVAGDAEP